jgi:hypothetical protein
VTRPVSALPSAGCVLLVRSDEGRAPRPWARPESQLWHGKPAYVAKTSEAQPLVPRRNNGVASPPRPKRGGHPRSQQPASYANAR